MRIQLARAIPAGTLILAAACSDRTEPTAPDNSPVTPSLQPGLEGVSDDPIALARQVPGFGGFYLDKRGTPVARVNSGDSGAPVFKGSSSVTLAGLLWGGNQAGTQFIYSPMANVERELGALTTF